MEPRNRGHAELLRLTARRGGKAEIARLAGVEPNQLTQWTEGKITPSGPSRTKLEKATGIGPTWWDQPVPTGVEADPTRPESTPPSDPEAAE